MGSAAGVWTSDHVALLLIDYQGEMLSSIRSDTPGSEIEMNVKFIIRAAKAFNIPIVLSTVAVEMGINGPTFPSILEELPGQQVIDRSTMNAWEDANFRAAVERTGKKRLVVCGLYTEICLAFPMVDLLAEGYEGMFIVDAVGGLSQTAHITAIDRLVAAGAVPNTALALVTELFRDWKSANADRIQPILAWRIAELAKLAAAR